MAQLTVLLGTLMMLLAACGGGDNNNDTILTGFSGVFIFGVVAYFVYRIVKKKTK